MNDNEVKRQALKEKFIQRAGHFLPTDELTKLRSDLASTVTDAVFVRIISSISKKIA
jgi:hypothetical protein